MREKHAGSIHARQGIVGIVTAIFVAAVIFGTAAAWLVWRDTRNPASGQRENVPTADRAPNLAWQTATVISQTFADVFNPAPTRPVAEIILSPRDQINLSESGNKNEDGGGGEVGNNITPSVETPPRAPEKENTLPPAANTPRPTTTPPENISPALCDFSVVGNAAEKKVVINEVAWMGSTPQAGESSTHAAGREWLELSNISDRTVSLSGWQLLGSNGWKILFGSEDKIPADNFYLLEKNDDHSVPYITADKIYSGKLLSNTGIWLRLFDARCQVVDELNAAAGWPGGDNAAKRTLERDGHGAGWHTSALSGGTPRAENSTPPPPTVQPAPAPAAPPQTPPESEATPTSPSQPSPPSLPPVTESSPQPPSTPTAGSQVVIYAVQITGGTGKTNNDFIKLYNPTAQAVDLSGWKLRKRTQSGGEASVRVFPTGSIIAAGGYFMWANSQDGFAASIDANAESTQTLAANNSAALADKDGNIIDAVAWGAEHSNAFGEGSAYPDNPGAGQILTRKTAGGSAQDTNNNAADFEISSL